MIHVFERETWPAALRSLLTWLEGMKWNVRKHFPKETMVTQVTLSEELREVSRQEVVAGLNIPINASTGLRFQRVYTTVSDGILMAHRSHPQWPNAMAVALVCYLLAYVYFNRHRSIMVTP